MIAIRIRTLVLVSFAMIAACGPVAPAFAQGTTTFTIHIPRKLGLGVTPSTSDPYPEIGTVKAIVSVASSSAVTFTITDPNGNRQSFPALTPGGTTQTLNFASGDRVTATPNTDPSDPSRYELDFTLRSDSATNCTSQQVNSDDTYTVAIGTTDPRVTGVCLESWDGLFRSISLSTLSCSNAALGANPIPVPPADARDRVASLDPVKQPAAGCFAQRPPVDVVLVLDKSGSMATATSSGLGTTRMDALHTAVDDFVNVWGSLPASSGGGVADRIGVIQFDTTASQVSALTDVTVAANRTNITSAVNAIAPGGSTSIGDGLMQGAAMLAPESGRRKVALLMSDGQQNTDALADGSGTQVATYCAVNSTPCGGGTPPTSKVALVNQPHIYTVTLGPTVSAMVNQDIANKSGGFYLNTEDPGQAGLLNPFFLELLQNFVRFNSYETVRLISETTPYSATVPISTTSHDLVLSLMWQPQRGPLRLTLTPPGGAAPIVRESASGLISVVENLPLSTPYDPRGDWKIEVAALPPDNVPAGTASLAVPFDLHAMTDDGGIKSELAVVPGDYKPGDKIRLRAKVTRFGLPILGLGKHPGDKIEVQLVRPGKSVGDILSESTASAVPQDPGDSGSAADSKLDNTLKNNPNVLKRESDTVQLFDDGKPEHGDDVAGDGIYSALYPAPLPGHYNFLFAVESVAPDTVRFSREQLRTAYVRPFPDAGNIGFQSNVISSGASNTLTIVMTPRTHAGDRMGPGWGNYFWFQTAGMTPFKGKDNLDGSYTATLAFTGSKPPKVSLGFVTAVVFIGDSVTYDQLPAPPTPLVDSIPEKSAKWAVFLDAGAGIPQGTFGSVFNTGFSLNAGLEYILASHLSVEGIFGYHDFPPNIGSNLNIYQFSANAKFYLNAPPNKLRPFVNGGIGGYKLNPGATNFGGNAGGGLLYSLTVRIGLEGSYNFHAINTPVAATKFSSLQGGVRLVF